MLPPDSARVIRASSDRWRILKHQIDRFTVYRERQTISLLEFFFMLRKYISTSYRDCTQSVQPRPEKQHKPKIGWSDEHCCRYCSNTHKNTKRYNNRSLQTKVSCCAHGMYPRMQEHIASTNNPGDNRKATTRRCITQTPAPINSPIVFFTLYGALTSWWTLDQNIDNTGPG